MLAIRLPEEIEIRLTSYFYPKYISPLTEKQKWQIFMGGFIVLFSVATIFEGAEVD